MSGEWVTLPLRDAGVSLIDCEHRTPPAAPSGFPYVAIPQMKQGRLDLSDARLIVAEHFTEWTRKARPRVHDVILSRRCNPGETVVVPAGIECALGQNLVLLRADGERVYPPFLRWLVRGPEWWDQIRTYLNVGAIFDSLKCADVPNFRLTIPPLPEQRAIAGVLGALDDKIEVNRKQARVLEGIARAVFTSWFVDFDPVRRRAGSGSGSAASLPADLAALFPKRLADSPIGEVPEGWRVAGIDEDIKFLNGLALQKFPPTNGRSLPVIKIAQLRKGDTEGADRASADLDPEYVVQDGDVLFSWSGSLECVLWAGGPGALNQHLFKVTSATMPKWFCYLWVHHHLPSFRHIAAGKATTMGHIQRHHLRQALVTVPRDAQLTRAMDQFFAPLIDAIFGREVQSRTLAALRDTLLPKLISGELRIADAERIVGRAV